jgi:hypothetical protein
MVLLLCSRPVRSPPRSSRLSQYPHEREVLLPPLTGLEALEHAVQGGVLVIKSRLSLNMAAHTLEQVLSRRRKMLMDMCSGIELEIRDQLDFKLGMLAIRTLKHALQFGPFSQDTEWFKCVAETPSLDLGAALSQSARCDPAGLPPLLTHRPMDRDSPPQRRRELCGGDGFDAAAAERDHDRDPHARRAHGQARATAAGLEGTS